MVISLSNFLFVVLAFFGPETFRGHVWPFTPVLRKIWQFVTRKVEKTTADYADVTDQGTDKAERNRWRC